MRYPQLLGLKISLEVRVVSKTRAVISGGPPMGLETGSCRMIRAAISPLVPQIGLERALGLNVAGTFVARA